MVVRTITGSKNARNKIGPLNVRSENARSAMSKTSRIRCPFSKKRRILKQPRTRIFENFSHAFNKKIFN